MWHPHCSLSSVVRFASLTDLGWIPGSCGALCETRQERGVIWITRRWGTAREVEDYEQSAVGIGLFERGRGMRQAFRTFFRTMCCP